MANRKFYQKLYRDNLCDPKHPIYVGKYYEKTGGIPAKHYKIKGLGLSAACILLLLLPGCIVSAQSKAFYSAVTYVATFLPAIYAALGWIKAPTDDGRIREDTYEDSFVRVQMWSALGLWFSGVAIVTAVIAPLVSNTYGPSEILYLFGLISVFAVFFVMRKLRMRQTYRLQDEKTESDG